jgi:hypothetical protein
MSVEIYLEEPNSQKIHFNQTNPLFDEFLPKTLRYPLVVEFLEEADFFQRHQNFVTEILAQKEGNFVSGLHYFSKMKNRIYHIVNISILDDWKKTLVHELMHVYHSDKIGMKIWEKLKYCQLNLYTTKEQDQKDHRKLLAQIGIDHFEHIASLMEFVYVPIQKKRIKKPKNGTNKRQKSK